MKKVLVFYITTMLLLSLTGCWIKGRLHTKKQLLAVLDNMKCDTVYGAFITSAETTSDSLLACNLKGKYTVLAEETLKANVGKKRILYVRLNDYDLEFHIESAAQCTTECSDYSPVFLTVYTYMPSTDFHNKASNYFWQKYTKEHDCVCDDSIYHECYVNTKEDVARVIKHIEGYLDYINSLDIRIMQDSHNSIEIIYPKNPNASKGKKSFQRLFFLLKNGKYSLRDYGTDSPPIEDLEQYILDFCAENEIFD